MYDFKIIKSYKNVAQKMYQCSLLSTCTGKLTKKYFAIATAINKALNWMLSLLQTLENVVMSQKLLIHNFIFKSSLGPLGSRI